MGISPFRKGRRAKRAWVDDHAPLTPRGMVDEKVRDVVSHSVAGFAIAGLGLAIAGGVIVTGAAQATEVNTSLTSIAAPDVTRAEPIPQAQKHDDNEVPPDTEDNSETKQDSTNGSLNNFDRSDGTSRNSVRSELNKGLTSRRAKERSQNLEAKGDDASRTSRTAVQENRTEILERHNAEVQKEEKRLQEEKKRKEEEARRRAEAQAGTLSDGMVPNYSSPANVAATGSGGAKPLPRYMISARWGQVGSWSRYHTGIDLAAPIGTPMYAAADGVVAQSNGGGWAGIHVVIRHADGSATLYAHMANRAVAPGTTVKAGQLIGHVGMTGRTFGPHLHFEFYPNASSVGNPYTTSDPYVWMLSKGVKL